MDDWIEIYIVTGRIILNFFPVFGIFIYFMIREWRLEKKGGADVEK